MPIDLLEQTGSPPVTDEPTAAARPWRRVRTLAGRTLLALVLFLVLGNGLIMGSMAWFRLSSSAAASVPRGIDNVQWVDEGVLRGAAPTHDGLRALADAGVTTVVDLRAEADLDANEGLLAELGMTRFSMPIRDGQLPTRAQAERFLEIVEGSEGAVFVHCGAGVGRTGALSAFYLNATDQASGTEALERNLTVGPPSLEQIVFSLTTADGDYDRPGVAVTAMSRVLDAPRRIWHNIT